MPLRQRDKRVRLLERRRDGLLDEQMDAALQRLLRDVEVRLGRHDNDCRVHRVQQRRQRLERARAEFARDARALFRVCVVESNERRAGLLAQ